MNCDASLCKRCWDALFLLSNSKDESLSARELMQTDDSLIKSSNFRKTTEKDFFDKDEEIKRLNAKIKGLEKKNIEQKKEINILNNKLEN